MAQVRVNEAQQQGAFNNGAVGQQSRALCPYPYVWDRVRKACVLPDEFKQVRPYLCRVPAYDRLSYLDYPGLLGIGLGASCPEGSGRTAAYTGPEGPDGCRCSPGRVWFNGYCQSPQGVVQQQSASMSDYAGMSLEQQMAQPLSDYAKQYFKMTNHSVSCKLVYPDPVPGGPNHPTMMCSIDGGPYEHGAYAINLNPETAIYSALRNKAAQQVSQQTGTAPGALYEHRSTREAVQSAVLSSQSQHQQQAAQALNQPPVPPVSIDTAQPGGGMTTQGGGYGYGGAVDMVQDPATGQWVAVDGDGNVLGDIPWWVWVAGAAGVYMVMKKK